MSPLTARTGEPELPVIETAAAAGLVKTLAEFPAFRHLFRGASIVLMRREKLAPLVAKVDSVLAEFFPEIRRFQDFLRTRPADIGI